MCGLIVHKEEIATNTHNCFNTLTQYLQKQIDEKESVIHLLRDELEKKNQLILQFIDKQNVLESRLQSIEEVLSYEDDSNFLSAQDKVDGNDTKENT